jgi:histidinol dehydrogenase
VKKRTESLKKMATKKFRIPIIDYSSPRGRKYLQKITSSRITSNKKTSSLVEKILDDVRNNGDRALFSYTEKFDKVKLTARKMRITEEEISLSAEQIRPELKTSINEAAKRIEAYHRKQLRDGFEFKSNEGTLGQIIRPLTRVGVYIPGGHTIYPSSVLMDIIPAQIAGVKEIVAVTPPREQLDPGVAYALKLLNITEIYRIGGAQAIAALAYGTKTIRPVEKIVGPGNPFVATAKKLVYGVVDIDSVAGPSEVAIIADNSADPTWVALDLLAQGEHGSGDELAICACEDKEYAEKVATALIEEIEASPVKKVFQALPVHAITIFVTSSRDESIALINDFAPEHLQIMTRNYREDLSKIRNAAAIFLGPYTPVALGDYFIGTNHVLPTGGAARYASPLGVDSFTKRISVAEVTPEGLDTAAPFVSVFARAENFVHHALSVERREGNQ